MTDPEPIVIVFAKPAVPGAVKTRLIPPLSPQQAAEFHLAALSDVLEVARQVAPQPRLLVAGDGRAVESLRRLHPGVDVDAQRGADLGERLCNAFGDAFAGGAERVLVVGSDHPSLPPAYLREALDSLGMVDAAIGPSDDGGYYAIAIRHASWPRAAVLFDSVPWSTADVLTTTLRRARAAGVDCRLTPGWYDVDTAEDLERFIRDAPPGSAAASYLEGLGRSGEQA